MNDDFSGYLADTMRGNHKLREELAAYAHEAWSGWMRWMFEKGGTVAEVTVEGETLECWVMSPASYRRWQRQMNTPYADLPESEKASDRAEADKIMATLRGDIV